MRNWSLDPRTDPGFFFCVFSLINRKSLTGGKGKWGLNQENNRQIKAKDKQIQKREGEIYEGGADNRWREERREKVRLMQDVKATKKN